MKKRKIEKLLKEYSKGYQWKYGNSNYYLAASIGWCTKKPVVEVKASPIVKSNNVYFSSSVDAYFALQKIGEKTLLKDYFDYSNYEVNQYDEYWADAYEKDDEEEE